MTKTGNFIQGSFFCEKCNREYNGEGTCECGGDIKFISMHSNGYLDVWMKSRKVVGNKDTKKVEDKGEMIEQLGDEKMGLREMAIDAYKKETEKVHKENMQEAEKFVVQAKELLRERIRDGFDEFTIQVISKGPIETVFDVDGIVFRVNQFGVGIVKRCQKCKTEYYEDLIHNFGDTEKVFQDIGKILSEPHSDYECQRALEEKEGKREPTTDEKFLQALKDFVQENTGDI